MTTTCTTQDPQWMKAYGRLPKRCQGCGMHKDTRSRPMYKDCALILHPGRWHCTPECYKDYLEYKKERFANSYGFRGRRDRGGPLNKQKRCEKCGTHRKKVKRLQPLFSWVFRGKWYCSEECKLQHKGEIEGIEALQEAGGMLRLHQPNYDVSRWQKHIDFGLLYGVDYATIEKKLYRSLTKKERDILVAQHNMVWWAPQYRRKEKDNGSQEPTE